MANPVDDIVIKVALDASNALNGLNDLKSRIQEVSSGSSKDLKNLRGASGETADGIAEDFETAGTASTKFEKQTSTDLQRTGRTMGSTISKSSSFGRSIRTHMKSAGDSIHSFGKTLKEKMGTEAGLAFAAAGAAALSFSKQCISAAMTAESEWSRYGALVNSSGGNWQAQQKDIKDWARTVSNEYGYATSDTRAASAALMQAGHSFSFVQDNMKAVSALAARTGSTQEEAANTIIQALNGKGRALLRDTGLQIENYKTADGGYDTQRLMTDILNQNTDALNAHGDTTEAMVNRLQNSWGALKTSLGQALLPILQMVVPFIQGVVDAFNKLPGPVKTVIAAILLIGGVVGVVLGALAMIAPALMTLGTIISFIASAGGVMAALGTVASTLAAAFPALAAAIGAVGSVLLPVIAIVLAVVAAFILLYEIGKRLGWWEDLGGMFQKFGEVIGWVGEQLMGFISWLGLLVTDFPAAMSQLGEALSGFNELIKGVFDGIGDWVKQGLTNALNDIPGTLSAIIDATPLGMIASAFGIKLSDALKKVPGYIMGSLGRIKDTIVNSIMSIPGRAVVAFERLKQAVQLKLAEIRTKAAQLMERIKHAILDPILGIPAWISFHLERMKIIFQQKLLDIRFKVAQLISRIRHAILDPIIGIPGWVAFHLERLKLMFKNKLEDIRFKTNQLMARIRHAIRDKVLEAYRDVRDWLGRVGPAVAEKLGEAASRAMEGAKRIYDSIVNKIMEIPRKVGEELNKIPGKIKSALSAAASQANLGAASIVASFMAGLVARSPGKIQRFTKWEFETLAGHIERGGVNATRSSYKAASNIVRAWTDAMPGVLKPQVEFGKVPSAVDLQRTMSITPLINSLRDMQTVPISRPATTTNHRVNNEDNSKHITIEHITLECGDLTQAQSKKVLYNALQGL